MLLVTILKRCYQFKRFVYRKTRFFSDRKGAVKVLAHLCEGSQPYYSGYGKRCAGYDRLPEQRFEFTPLWSFRMFFLYACRRASGVVTELLP